MKNNNLKTLAERLAQAKRINEKRNQRRAHFKRIGRKGGLVKKDEKLKLKHKISTRLNDDEFEKFKDEMKKYNLSQAKLLRLKVTNTELKINEFIEDEQLYKILTDLSRIGNLLKHNSWKKLAEENSFSNLLDEVLFLLKNYLTQRIHKE